MSTQLQAWEGAVKKAGSRFSAARTISTMKWAQEKVHVMSLIRSNPKLKKALPESIEQAILQAASMGLSYNPTLKQCYMIPRKIKRNDPNSLIIAYASPSYMGILHLAVESGAIIYGAAEVVYHADEFEYYGPMEKPLHKPTLKADSRTEHFATGVYACVKLPSGDYRSEYIDRATVMKIRSMSEMPNGTMWDASKLWTEGWKKAAIRRLMKTIPASNPRMIAANEVLDQNESFEMKDVNGERVEESITEEQAADIVSLLTEIGRKEAAYLAYMGLESLNEMPVSKYKKAIKELEAFRE